MKIIAIYFICIILRCNQYKEIPRILSFHTKSLSTLVSILYIQYKTTQTSDISKAQGSHGANIHCTVQHIKRTFKQVSKSWAN